MLVEAQQMIGAGHDGALQFLDVGRVDAHAKARRVQSGDRLLHMRERRVGQTAEIDDVRARGAEPSRAFDDRRDAHRRGVDDLGEEAHVLAREIRLAAGAAEIRRQIGDFFRPALDACAQFARKQRKIGAAAARQNDAVGLHGAGQAAQNDLLRHQRRDLHADVVHAPAARRVAEAPDHPLQARIGETPGQEQQAFAHPCGSASSFLRASTASSSDLRLSTTVVASKDFSRSLFSRSMRRG